MICFERGWIGPIKKFVAGPGGMHAYAESKPLHAHVREWNATRGLL